MKFQIKFSSLFRRTPQVDPLPPPPPTGYLTSLKLVLHYYFAFYSCCFFLLLTAMLCLPLFIFSPRNVSNALHYATYCGRHFRLFYGCSFELRGATYMATQESAVLVANHQHALDMIGMFSIWREMGRCAAVVKKETFWYWPFGLSAWLAGVVFIDRKDPQKAQETLNATQALLQDGGKVFVFPEGTRNRSVKTTERLLPFKKGAFHTAIQSNVPILPLVFSPYYFLDDEKHKLWSGGKIIISVLPPVSTTGIVLTEVQSLVNSVQSAMQREYDRLCIQSCAMNKPTALTSKTN